MTVEYKVWIVGNIAMKIMRLVVYSRLAAIDMAENWGLLSPLFGKRWVPI